MSTTDYAAQQVLANLLGNTMGTPAWPSAWYLAASTTAPAYSKGTGTPWNFTEPVDSAYSRQLVTLAPSASQPVGAYGMSLSAATAFPAASVNWGTVHDTGLFDALTGGNLWLFAPLMRTVTDGALTAGSTTLSSATANFAAGDVGQLVYAPGLPLGTTIVSVTSATAVVLSAQSASTGSALYVGIATPVAVNSGSVLTLPTNGSFTLQ
jgi:hypothetical protein